MWFRGSMRATGFGEFSPRPSLWEREELCHVPERAASDDSIQCSEFIVCAEQSLALKGKPAIVASKHVNPTVCPQCHKDLPQDYKGRYCPDCGEVLPFKINWWIFFTVFLAPPLLTMLVAFLGREQSNEQLSPVVAFVGGTAGGIASGVMLALRLGKTCGVRFLLGVVFSIVLAIACVTASSFGCLSVGYRLNFH
jgi:hypothetical protein